MRAVNLMTFLIHRDISHFCYKNVNITLLYIYRVSPGLTKTSWRLDIKRILKAAITLSTMTFSTAWILRKWPRLTWKHRQSGKFAEDLWRIQHGRDAMTDGFIYVLPVIFTWLMQFIHLKLSDTMQTVLKNLHLLQPSSMVDICELWPRATSTQVVAHGYHRGTHTLWVCSTSVF